MSDNKKQRTAEIINPGLGDIEKVRDILFGKYVANFQERFDELETRLEADVDTLKQRLTDKISTMDDAVSESLKQLDTRLAEEQKVRGNELDSLQNSLQATLTEAEKKLQHAINLMEDETSQNLKSIRDAIEAAKEELAKEADTQQKKLEQDKVGRQSLALMLDEVAIKLRGED